MPRYFYHVENGHLSPDTEGTELPGRAEAWNIRLEEQSHLPAKRTPDKLGIPRSTFNRWYDRFLAGGVEALEDSRPRPKRVWNRILDVVRSKFIELALDKPKLSPRELAVTFADTKSHFVSEASVYRLLEAHDLMTSPALIVNTAGVFALAED